MRATGKGGNCRPVSHRSETFTSSHLCKMLKDQTNPHFSEGKSDESPLQKRRINCVTFKQRIVAKMQRIGLRCQAVRELL